jgi:hypothetical protein
MAGKVTMMLVRSAHTNKKRTILYSELL